MNSWLSNVCAVFTKSRNRRVSSPKNLRVRLGVEELEQREVMTASPFSAGGILVPSYAYPTTSGGIIWSDMTAAAKSGVHVEGGRKPR